MYVDAWAVLLFDCAALPCAPHLRLGGACPQPLVSAHGCCCRFPLEVKDFEIPLASAAPTIHMASVSPRRPRQQFLWEFLFGLSRGQSFESGQLDSCSKAHHSELRWAISIPTVCSPSPWAPVFNTRYSVPVSFPLFLALIDAASWHCVCFAASRTHIPGHGFHLRRWASDYAPVSFACLLM